MKVRRRERVGDKIENTNLVLEAEINSKRLKFQTPESMECDQHLQ